MVSPALFQKCKNQLCENIFTSTFQDHELELKKKGTWFWWVEKS